MTLNTDKKTVCLQKKILLIFITSLANKNPVQTLVSKAQLAKFILDVRVNPSIIQNKVRSKRVHYPGQVTFQQLHVLFVLVGKKENRILTFFHGQTHHQLHEVLKISPTFWNKQTKLTANKEK